MLFSTTYLNATQASSTAPGGQAETNGRRSMAETVTLANIRRLHGECVEEATLARDLLAPARAAGRLSGDPSARCVLVRSSGSFRHPDDARRDLARFGPIEAVAVCGTLHKRPHERAAVGAFELETVAVVVFQTVERASVALYNLGLDNLQLPGQPRKSAVLYGRVPPIYMSFPSCLIQPELVQLAFYPPPPPAPSRPPQGALPTTSGEAREGTMVQPRTEVTVEYMKELLVPISTTFVLSMNSRAYGPSLGPDGHLWIHGNKFTRYSRGLQIDDLLVRVTQVAPSYYILQPHVYCNLVLL